MKIKLARAAWGLALTSAALISMPAGAVAPVDDPLYIPENTEGGFNATYDFVKDTTYFAGQQWNGNNAEFTSVGNDCSGDAGIGFESCMINDSPVIAKYDVGSGWTFNTQSWSTISADDFDITINGDGTFTWTYTPGAGDPQISWWVSKNSDEYRVYRAPGATTDTAGLWNGKGVSHITFYDTSDPNQQVPIPAAAWLLGSGLLGLMGIGRRRKAAVAA